MLKKSEFQVYKCVYVDFFDTNMCLSYLDNVTREFHTSLFSIIDFVAVTKERFY